MRLSRMPVRASLFIPLVLFFGLLVLPWMGEAGERGRVFGLVALGEPSESVIKRLGRPQVAKTNLLGWYHKGPGAGVSVIVHGGRVAAVAAAYFRPSWAQFHQLERDLTQKYGSALNLDYFPPGADTFSQKISAIRLGQGRAARRWKTDRFTVRLLWAKPNILIIRYDHPALWAAYRKKKESEDSVVRP